MSAVRTLLDHPDPRVAALYRGLAGKPPRIAAPIPLTVPGRANRVAKSASVQGAPVVSRAGNSKADRPGTSSRFAHWSTITLPTDSAGNAARPIAPATAGLKPPMPRGAMLREIVANGGRVSGCNTAEDAAALVLRSAAKPDAPARRNPLAEPDMSTPEGVAAFVLSAGRRPGIVK